MRRPCNCVWCRSLDRHSRGYSVILQGVLVAVLAALTCWVLLEMFLQGAP